MRVLLAALAVLVVACSSPKGGDAADRLDSLSIPSVLEVTSPSLTDGEPIPIEYTCDGDDVPPPLSWSGVPDETVELALVVDDPDAPRGTYVHWIVIHLDPYVAGIEGPDLPAGAGQARNSANHARYDGPCPPRTGIHHYRFTVYALDARLDIDDDAGTTDALEAIAAHATARGRLVTTYDRE